VELSSLRIRRGALHRRDLPWHAARRLGLRRRALCFGHRVGAPGGEVHRRQRPVEGGQKLHRFVLSTSSIALNVQ
jgi:hypothetical protein